MLLKAVLNEFIYECKIRNLTPQTIKSYRNGNNLMIQWLNENRNITDIEQVKSTDLKAYIFLKFDNKAKESYINGIIKQMRAFFKYAVDNEYIAVNPVLKVNWAKESKTLIKTFTNKQAVKLSNAFTNSNYLESRNKTIIIMLLDTGIRNNELCMLTDTSISDNVLTILGKGNKERQVGISPLLQKQLIIYHRIKNAYFQDKQIHNDFLFLSRTGRKCTVNTIENIMTEAGARIGIDDNIRCSPHTCRHFYAQTMVKNGIDIYSLSRLLGHGNISITQRYLESMLDKDIVDRSIKTSPLMTIDNRKD
ncbi:MAG: tyrosine-type recombinase/integrase [Clostridia bacterium]|nr:tyrosine-type recombinase/integrase [Clostridia bacterium]